jgi:hypothetical protein
MKRLLNHTKWLAAVAIIFAASCKKELATVYYETGTPPVLSSTSATIAPLSVANKTAVAVDLRWTNPNYVLTTGLSSQDVTYTIQIDTVGANFTNPKKGEIAIAKNLGASILVSELNATLTKMELAADVPHNLEFRVVSSINKTIPLTSNVLRFNNVVPYEDFAIPPPASNQMFMVGDATPGGWGNPVPEPAQKMTTVKKGLYEIELQLNGGKFYLFLPVNGSWDTKYGAIGSNGTNNPDGDSFKAGGGDLKAPDASGKYRITLDFKLGRFTVTKI